MGDSCLKKVKGVAFGKSPFFSKIRVFRFESIGHHPFQLHPYQGCGALGAQGDFFLETDRLSEKRPERSAYENLAAQIL